jgi:hypothetical protein
MERGFGTEVGSGRKLRPEAWVDGWRLGGLDDMNLSDFLLVVKD